MIDQVIAFIIGENKWFTVSIGAALIASIAMFLRPRGSVAATRHRVMVAMNMFFGVTIGTMAFGHLLAVTTKLTIGTLEGPTVVFYAIGVALAVPSWWLIAHTWRHTDAGPDPTALRLNVGVATVLLVLGLPNIPLAIPALLNIAYARHHRPMVGRAIVGVASMTYLALFVGSLVFWASGQSFEQFSGMQ